MIILATSQPSQTDLSTEWHKITGDSMVVDCRPILGDPAEGFMEVFKYAVKFSDLTFWLTTGTRRRSSRASAC